MSTKQLSMNYAPNTIEHLGAKMYSRLPNALAELIANAYDADAENVHITLTDISGKKSIMVEDDGIGMSFDDINKKFLLIGRKRRNTQSVEITSKGRKVTGRKGLGKLALFGIGHHMKIFSCKGGEQVEFDLDWDDIKKQSTGIYNPLFNITKCDDQKHGVTIILTDLNRATGFKTGELAASLSRLFSLFDNNFKVTVRLNENSPIQIDQTLRYQGILRQFEWKFPQDIDKLTVQFKFDNAKEVIGEIFSSEKPIKPDYRGITLFAHGRLVNVPEFFGVSESSHAYSYLTGWLNVDFVDELSEDVISTDRQSLNWDISETLALKTFLQQIIRNIERDWREKRKEERQNTIRDKTKINTGNWYSTLPRKVRKPVKDVVESIENSEIPSQACAKIIEKLHELVPEFAPYHWRDLHPEIQDASREYYMGKNYYSALHEAMKRYNSFVRTKATSSESDRKLFEQVLGNRSPRKPCLFVTKRYKGKKNCLISENTFNNIEEGQKWLSIGTWAGFRNPLSHEEIESLRSSSLITEQDCLDCLSILSHLFKRIEESELEMPS